MLLEMLVDLLNTSRDPFSRFSGLLEAAFHRCSYKKAFWKYAANLHLQIPMPKSDFNKVGKQLYWNHTSTWVFSCTFTSHFQSKFSWEHFRRAALALRFHWASLQVWNSTERDSYYKWSNQSFGIKNRSMIRIF